MIIAFIVWSVVAVIFLIIGVSTWKAKEAAGFFTFVNPPKVKDVRQYNHAVAKLWLAAALIFEILGIPMLWIEQNSPQIIFTILGVMVLVITMMVVYTRVETKYKL